MSRTFADMVVGVTVYQLFFVYVIKFKTQFKPTRRGFEVQRSKMY